MKKIIKILVSLLIGFMILLCVVGFFKFNDPFRLIYALLLIILYFNLWKKTI